MTVIIKTLVISLDTRVAQLFKVIYVQNHKIYVITGTRLLQIKVVTVGRQSLVETFLITLNVW